MTPVKAQAARRAWVLHLGRCRQCRNPGPSLCWRGKLMAVRVLEGMTDGESLYVKIRRA